MDVKGFYPYIQELTNDILIFKPEHLQAATKILNELNPNQNIMISIHVRLTDIERHLKKLFNVEYTPDDYFKRAMAYFHKKYKNVIFYVLSDDTRKAKAKLTNANFNSKYNIVYVGNGYSTLPGTNIVNFS